MRNWDDLQFVHALANAGTVTKAAKLMRTNAATVSRRIERVAKAIGGPVFIKNGDSWQPTEEGAKLVEIASAMRGQIDGFKNSLAWSDENLEGSYRIKCYEWINSTVVARHVENFHNRFPNAQLITDYWGDDASLARGDFDIEIMVGRPTEGRLIAKRISTRRGEFYKRKGSTIGDGWIGLSDTFDNLPFMQAGRDFFGCEPMLRFGNLHSIEIAIAQSNMPGPAASCIVKDNDALESLGEPALVSVSPVYLVYHESRRKDSRLLAVADWLAGSFPGPTKCICGECSL